MIRWLIVLSVVYPRVGCNPEWEGADGQLLVGVSDVEIVDNDDAQVRLLQDSQFCIQHLKPADDPGQPLGDQGIEGCFNYTPSAELVQDGRCFVASATGAATLQIEQHGGCGSSDLPPDRLELEVLNAAQIDVQTWAGAGFDLYVRGVEFYRTGLGEADFAGPLVVLADHPVPVELVPATPEGDSVGWTPRLATVTLDQGAVEWANKGWFEVSQAAGSRSALRLHTGAEAVTVTEVEGIGPERIASLSIEPVWVSLSQDPDAEPTTFPLGAIAAVRDDEGRVVWGVPVSWKQGGRHVIFGPAEQGGVVLGEQWASIYDVCRPNDQTRRRRVTLTAMVETPDGTLRESTTLTWQFSENDLDVLREVGLLGDGPFEPAPDCAESRGCAQGCSATSTTAAGSLAPIALMLALGLVGLRRRPKND